jgi:hypothetical protein
MTCLLTWLVGCSEVNFVDKEDGEVGLAEYANLLDWFGPLNEPGLVDRVYLTLKAPYFHGKLSSSEAESALLKCKGKRNAVGVFLIRFSTSEPGCYAISVLEAKEIKHYRITRSPEGKFLLGTNRFNSLDELVNKCRSALHLKTPCAGSPYAYLFTRLGRSRAESLADGYVEFQIPTS